MKKISQKIEGGVINDEKKVIIIIDMVNQSLEAVRNTVVSKTLRKKRVVGTEILSCKMEPSVAMSFLFTSLSIPPIDTISAYAAASLFPSNDIGTDPFNTTITNCTYFYFIWLGRDIIKSQLAHYICVCTTLRGSSYNIRLNYTKLIECYVT